MIWKFSLPALVLLALLVSFTNEVKALLSNQTEHCDLTAAQLDEFIKLDFENFDQTEDKGSRALSKKSCHNLAGFLSDAYHLSYPSLKPWQNRILYWHAGQYYAFGGTPELAMKRFSLSYDEKEPSNPELEWNAYVSATIAFLKNDKKSLVINRDKVARAKKNIDLNNKNLLILDRMISCFGKPYFDVYRQTKTCP